MDSVREGEGGKIWENGIETCKISCMKRVASPGSMHDTGCLGLVHWDHLEGWNGEGGGRRVHSHTPLHTQLPVPDPPEGLLHLWVSASNPSPQNLASPPQQIPLISKITPASPENPSNTQLPGLTSPSLKESREHLGPISGLGDIGYLRKC